MDGRVLDPLKDGSIDRTIPQACLDLSSTLSKVTLLIKNISTAEQRAASVAEFLASAQVGYDRYGNRTVSEHVLTAARRVNALIKTELVAAVEAEHHAYLLSASRELEALRDVIPQMAAKAALEISALARDLAALAKSEA